MRTGAVMPRMSVKSEVLAHGVNDWSSCHRHIFRPSDGLQGEQDRAAKKFGVESTPTVFVNGKKVPDIRTVNDLAKVIDPLLPKS